MTKKEAQEKIVKWAKAQLGYSAGAKKNNKYAAELDTLGPWFNGRKNFFDWCCCFVTDGFYQCFKDQARAMLYQPARANDLAAACPYAYNYFKRNGAGSNTPEIGAQIFFGPKGDEEHTGIVIDFDSSYVYTIEGNAGGGNGKVLQRKYSRSSSHISGYGIPKWSLVSKVTPTPDPEPEPSKDYEKVKPGTVYIVKPGDTLSAIAKKYGTTAANLGKLNGIKNINVISIGQKIVIKAAETASDKKTIDQIAKEVIDGKWGNGSARTTALLNAGYNPTEVQNKVNEILQVKTYYTVKRGDTLSAIAKKYGTPMANIIAWNGIKDKNKIQTGQILRVK